MKDTFFIQCIYGRAKPRKLNSGTGKTQQNPEKFIALKYYFLKMSLLGRGGGEGTGYSGCSMTREAESSPRTQEKRKLEKNRRDSACDFRNPLRRVSHLFSLKIHIRFPSISVRKLILRNAGIVEIPGLQRSYFPSLFPVFAFFQKHAP